MLRDPKDLERRHELGLAHSAHVGGRPALFVPRAFFAARGGDAHHPVTVANGLGHQAGHKVRLVVRMRPDAEQGPERRDRDRHGSRAACMAAGSLPQPSRVTTWWTAHASTVRGKSTRKWPPRL